MKKNALHAVIILIMLVVLPHFSFSQNLDSISRQAVSAVMQQMDSMQRADSLRKVTLLFEIERLRASKSDQLLQELAQQLEEIETQDSARNVAQAQQLEKLKKSSTGFPVDPFQDTLFYIYRNIGSFTAKERASTITKRIRKLYDSYEFDPDSLQVSENDASADLVYRGEVVMTITAMDAMWVGKTPRVLAVKYRDRIRSAITLEQKTNSVINILIRVGAIVLILTGIYILIRLVNRLFAAVRKRMLKAEDKWLNGLRIGTYQFLDRTRAIQVTVALINILRLAVILIALYLALPLLFSVFPWTQGIAVTLTRWILDPLRKAMHGLLSYLPNLFTILVILLITYYVSKFIKFIASEIERGALVIPGFFPDWARPTLNIIKFLLYAFSFIVIFPYLPGSDSPIFQGVSVFVGILFSLGSSSAISNAVAGLVITYMRPFRIGDRIRIGEHTGDVTEKSLLVTRIRTIKNEEITIPNASVLSSHTINYTSSAKDLGLILHSGVTIGYDIPWKKVHELLIDAARSTAGIVTGERREPFVLQTSLDDFYVSYQINAYTEEPHRMASIYSELHQNIQDKFNEAGVEILSPHYRAAREGNMIAIPPNYLAKDYKAPTFHVSLENKK